MNLQKTGWLFIIAMVFVCSCQSKQKHTSDFDKLQRSLVQPDSLLMKVEANEVFVYYFHATRRCATCEAVEATTQEALKEFYGTKVSFTSINREEESENPLLGKYKISGQTLLIVKGDKVIDLTSDAFMNARTNPDKFKAKIKEIIDPMI